MLLCAHPHVLHDQHGRLGLETGTVELHYVAVKADAPQQPDLLCNSAGALGMETLTADCTISHVTRFSSCENGRIVVFPGWNDMSHAYQDSTQTLWHAP